MSLIDVALRDRILTLTVNRPDKLNALNTEVMKELDLAVTAAGANPEVGALIVTGAGDKAFVAGADIANLATLTPIEGRDYSLWGQGIFERLESLGKPSIAALNGFALGGGCELALACTLRIAATTAQIGLPEVSLGLIPGYAGTQRLARLIGKGRALELILTADRISAEEALRVGLVNRVVEPVALMDAARGLAERILSRGPVAVRYAMEAVHIGLEMPFSEGAFLEATLFGLCAATTDMKEGTSAFLEKRKPVFTGK